ARRARRHVGGLGDRLEEAGDAARLLNHGDALHPAVALGAFEHVDAEGAGEELRPGAVAAPPARRLRWRSGVVLDARAGGWPRRGAARGAVRGRHGLGGASTREYLTVW